MAEAESCFPQLAQSTTAKPRNKTWNTDFIFVRSDGAQLKEITKIIEKNNIVPPIHPTLFSIGNVNEALELVANGRPKGKVIIQFLRGK